ncbi:MAG: hypothetical protein ABIT83_17310 [Massilia sp.]
MSGASSASHLTAGVSPAARALHQANSGIGKWLSDLVTGTGSSPAHIIITGILGVVPGIGQAMDARDLIIGVIAVTRSPAAIGGWVELVITLIGCVPAVGDALKVGFKLMKQGHNFGRVLEATSPALHGNVERFMRKIDWGMLASESKGLFNKLIAAFIDGLDSWVVKVVAGGPQVKQIIHELKAVQGQGAKMIDQAFAELKLMHTKMIGHELPGSTAAVAATSGKTVKRETQEVTAAGGKKQAAAANAERKLLANKSRDVKANRAAPNSTKNSTKKKAQPKKQKWRSGVPAEHITDYHVKKKFGHFEKANNHGKLTEEHSLPHTGIDHLWSNKTHLPKKFVVGETKSSIFDSFKLLAALPADLQAQFAALRADEAANPTSNNGKPNIFQNEGRDAHTDTHVQAGSSPADEQAVRRGVNKPDDKTGLATQMSHKWIRECITNENSLTPSGTPMQRLVVDFYEGDIACPYQRWIALVTGRQLHKHQKSKGALHEIQTVLHLPDNILKR